MNKYQEALDEFWEAYVTLIGMNKKTIILKNGDYEHDFIKYKKLLQELVEKATPKKPIEKTYEYESMNEEIIIKTYHVCGCEKYSQVHNIYRFCPKCGQALSWEE